jgi:hypothetical protein
MLIRILFVLSALLQPGADMNTSFNPFPLVFAGVAVLVVANFLVGDLTSSL